MALTFNVLERSPARRGGKREGLVDITFDNSYPTGGYAVLASSLGLNRIRHMQVENLPGYTTRWDHVNNKIMVYQSAGAAAAHAELANASAVLNNMVARATYWGE